jgi:ATP-dependent helicase/nuclease subunit A
MNPTNSPNTGTNDTLAAAHPGTNATVSASAGTGKTWLLVTRIIRLLLADAEPGSILALTFTRKAAAEMQIRLQERLHQMATVDDTALSALLTQFGSASGREIMDKARELYEKLLHANSQVRLQTFHSFCQDILSHFPLEAGITPGFELIENTAMLQQQAWEELFAEATRNPQGRLANDLDILMQSCNGPANTRQSLHSMLDHRSDWWAFSEHQADPAAYAGEQLQRHLQLEETPDPFAEFFSDISVDDFRVFANLLRQHETATNLRDAGHIDGALQTGVLDEGTFKQLRSVFLTRKHEPRSRKPSKSQAKNMGSEAEARFLALHRRICESMQRTLELSRRIQALELNAVWYRTGQRFIELYQKLKREQRVLDFTDLEWNCYRLLNDADNAHWVQYKIDQRIDHVLIDEFQDTNPTQWQLITPLLEEISAGPDERSRSFFLVGDEKQSIYSFRRANPKLQQQASDYLAQSMSALDVKLDASRRSSPAVIETVNAVFSQDDILRYMHDFTTHGTHLEHIPGLASLFPLHEDGAENGGEEEQSGDTGLRNPLLEPRKEHSVSIRSHEAHQIADEIQRLLDDRALIIEKDADNNDYARPVEYGDIMILMRNRTHVSEYESVLRDRGIPFIGSQRGSLLENQEIQDLEKLLDILITPFNNLSIAQVLKSPIFAASDQDLVRISLMHKDHRWYQRLLLLDDGLAADHPLMRAARLLPRWHALADTMPVHDLIDRIYAEGNVIQRYVTSVPAAQQQRVKANLRRFHELSLELDSGRYPSLSHFLHYLRSIRAHRDGRPDEPAATDGNASVSLMTIHASKGLEAPVVILADCDNPGGHHNAYSALVDWPAQSRKPVRFQLITASENTDEITRAVLTKKEEAQKREELNLLYVALTRARQYLLVTGSAGRSSSGWHRYIATGMKTLTAADAAGTYRYSTGSYNGIRVKESTMPETSEIAVDPQLTTPIPHLASREQLIAPSHSYHADNDGHAAAHDGEATRRGIAIHRALDLMTREPPLTSQQARRRIQLESGSLDDKELDQWLEEAVRTINNKDFSAVFRPGGSHRTLNELPVMYRQDQRSVFGVIDRLVITDKAILLVDYKTHKVDDSEQLTLLAASFREQMRLYEEGVAKLWPGLEIKSGLLFTHSARLVWLDQDS